MDSFSILKTFLLLLRLICLKQISLLVFFIENTIVLTRGRFCNGIFQVITFGFPSLDGRDETLMAHPEVDFFGCGRPSKEDTVRLAYQGQVVNDTFVILSDIWLDDQEASQLLCFLVTMPQLVSTIIHQSHLCPLPLIDQPIIWNYGHCLRLYPTPRTVNILKTSYARLKFKRAQNMP